MLLHYISLCVFLFLKIWKNKCKFDIYVKKVLLKNCTAGKKVSQVNKYGGIAVWQNNMNC